MKIGMGYWARAVMMVCSFTAVVFAIRYLVDKGPHVTVCPTRVKSISVVGQFAILEDQMKWYRTGNDGRHELNSVAVEKWLSEYCRVPAQALPQPAETKPLLTLTYVAGPSETIMQAADGTFMWQGKRFASAKLKQAIEALTDLANAPTR